MNLIEYRYFGIWYILLLVWIFSNLSDSLSDRLILPGVNIVEEVSFLDKLIVWIWEFSIDSVGGRFITRWFYWLYNNFMLSLYLLILFFNWMRTHVTFSRMWTVVWLTHLHYSQRGRLVSSIRLHSQHIVLSQRPLIIYNVLGSSAFLVTDLQTGHYKIFILICKGNLWIKQLFDGSTCNPLEE
jgi:hypothetical protein